MYVWFREEDELFPFEAASKVSSTYWIPPLLTWRKAMAQNNDTIRELSAAELDEVGGGLSLGLGLELDLSSELGAVSGTVGQVGGLVSGLVGGLLGAVGGLLGR